MAPSRVPIPITQRARKFCEEFTLNFANEAFIQEALRAAGAGGSTAGNKNLALIGDSILRTYFQIEGYKRGKSRGEIDDIVKKLACNAHLTKRGFDLGLDAYIWNNPSQGNVISDGLMATTVEAIIGAAFLANGQALATTTPVITAFGLTWPEEE
ncbi:ribonuclease III domain-containing protein [Aspergillus pseudoustus]|uniref:Ribonuclease III domain-containing protein n=1 Tax=Aspergillus pseudoustus TaxID=1810923 RepID=A0ABR4IM85_9EURO